MDIKGFKVNFLGDSITEGVGAGKDGRYPTNGHDLGCETAIGEGKVDFHALFVRLNELGYNRYVTIEREIGGEQQRIDILNSLVYLRDIIDDIYGGGTVC